MYLFLSCWHTVIKMPIITCLKMSYCPERDKRIKRWTEVYLWISIKSKLHFCSIWSSTSVHNPVMWLVGNKSLHNSTMCPVYPQLQHSLFFEAFLSCVIFTIRNSHYLKFLVCYSICPPWWFWGVLRLITQWNVMRWLLWSYVPSILNMDTT